MALGLETGSEQHARLARAVIGGLLVSVAVTVFLVPTVYLFYLFARCRQTRASENGGTGTMTDKLTALLLRK